MEVPRPEGEIPHFGNAKNPDLYEFAQEHNLPAAGVMGGAETQYPEYAARLQEGFKPEQTRTPLGK